MGFELRDWEQGLITSLAENANDARIGTFLSDLFPYPYTIEAAKSFVAHVRNHPQDIFRAIVMDDRAIGCISLTRLGGVKRFTAELGYWLNPSYWGHGIMTEAVLRLCQEAFLQSEIVRIQAEVFASNHASVRVLEKCGFQREGISECAVYKHATFHSLLLYGLIRPEAYAAKSR